ncbi:hypothetical protein [Thalassoglobus polymorphus]|nr:hypothetical protein [Thalassoglobus polymorphus]
MAEISSAIKQNDENNDAQPQPILESSTVSMNHTVGVRANLCLAG